MKKLLILSIITLLTILIIVTAINGLHIGSLEILGIKGMQAKNEDLDEKIQEATRLASTDFKNAQTQVTDNMKQLESKKQEYQDMVTVSTDTQVEEASQITQYESERIDTAIGGHARSEGVTLDLEYRQETNNVRNTYNLYFTVVGQYVNIIEFISDIEDDKTLGFKIENFKMVGDSNNNVKATFVCRDIAIIGISSLSSSTSETTTDNGTNTNSSNSSNTNTSNTNTSNTNTTSSNSSNSTNTNSTNTTANAID